MEIILTGNYPVRGNSFALIHTEKFMYRRKFSYNSIYRTLKTVKYQLCKLNLATSRLYK